MKLLHHGLVIIIDTMYKTGTCRHSQEEAQIIFRVTLRTNHWILRITSIIIFLDRAGVPG